MPFFKKQQSNLIPGQSDVLLDGVVVERLESKLMLAGVVKVSVNGRGDLTVKGNGDDNYVTITAVDTGADGIDDSYTITGNPSPDGEETLIKVGSQTMASTTVSVSGKLKISMGGGDDFVRIEDVDHGGDFQYTGGGGGDSLGIFDSRIDGLMKWKEGSGNDADIIKDSVLNGSLNVNTGNGSDWIAFIDSTLNGSEFKGKTGGGPDLLSFEGTMVNSAVDVNMGGFPDEVYLGSGTTFAGAVDIDMSSFADALKVENGVTFNMLSDVVITANKRGPNYENAAFIETGVSLASLPDLSSYGLVFDGLSDLSAEFDTRLGNIDVDIEFYDSVRMMLYDRGFAWSELPVDQSVLSAGEMTALQSNIQVGLDSPDLLERLLFKNIFEDDYA